MPPRSPRISSGVSVASVAIAIASITTSPRTARAEDAQPGTSEVSEASEVPADDAGKAPPVAEEPTVHVRFPAGTRLPYLDRQTPGGWTLACTAPCDRPLAGGTYRIRGRTGGASEPFVLPGTRRVDVDAMVGSPAVGFVAPTMMVTGGLVAVGGALLMLWPRDEGASAGAVAVGGGMIAVGVLFVGLGLVLRGFADSSATVSPSASVAPGDPGPGRRPPGAASRSTSTNASGVRWNGTGLSF